MKDRILSILSDIKALESKNPAEHKLPENVYYLNESDILCYPRAYGESRYPYEMDGLNLWIHSTGMIDACESNFVIFRQAAQQEEATVDFWGGVENGDEWIPVSITGISKPLYEPTPVSRYMVYGKRAAYFIADTEKCIFAVRAHITSKKQINFTLSAINKTDAPVKTYLTSFINPMLRFTNNEDGWLLWNRHGFLGKNGSFKLYRNPNPENTDIVDLRNFAVINKAIVADSYDVESTVSIADFLGQWGHTLFNATSLRSGHFAKQSKAV
ncbi:MAG: hypothetical protein IJO50_00405, partial [Clostridia bacterium]|nr:hypothetical protein [Clostridia bacterium]